VDSVRLARLAGEAVDLLAGGEAGRAVERAEEARALWRGRPFAAAGELARDEASQADAGSA
jgi:hypothetical protein